MVLHARGVTDDAAYCYRQAARFDAADMRWPYLLGVNLARADPEAAVASFDAARTLGRSTVPLQLHRGAALLAMGRLDAAADAYRAALALDDRSVPALVGLGQTAAARGNLQASRPYLARALSSAPPQQRREAYAALARVERRLGNRDAARKAARRAAALPQSGAWFADPLRDEMLRYRVTSMAALELAKRRYLRGDLRGALGYLDQAIERKPDFARAYYNRALIKQALGELEAAIADLDDSIRLDPTFPDAQHARSTLLAGRANR